MKRELITEHYSIQNEMAILRANVPSIFVRARKALSRCACEQKIFLAWVPSSLIFTMFLVPQPRRFDERPTRTIFIMWVRGHYREFSLKRSRHCQEERKSERWSSQGGRPFYNRSREGVMDWQVGILNSRKLRPSSCRIVDLGTLSCEASDK